MKDEVVKLGMDVIDDEAPAEVSDEEAEWVESQAVGECGVCGEGLESDDLGLLESPIVCSRCRNLLGGDD